MAYSSPSTQVTGYVVLAADWNEFVNNFLAMAPDVFTTSGDIYVASGANAGARQAAMTQAQAEAGSDTTVRGVTAQRINQAITAFGESAKVWVDWEQTGAHGISASFNMTSVTDGGGAGDTDHLFATDFSTADYSIVGSSSDNAAARMYFRSAARAATGINSITVDSSDNGADEIENSFVAFGAQ